MMRPIHRITLILLALFIGIAFVALLTYMGKKTQGPIEDAFTGAGEVVRGIEEKFILEKRTEIRKQELQWLNKQRETLLDPPRILLGAFDEKLQESLKEIFDLEKTLETTFPLVHIYTAWGSKEEQKFPRIYAESIHQCGSIPVITWEPWLTDFDNETFSGKLRPIETRDKNGLLDISRGVYDEYLRTWARDAAKFGHPLMVRLGHEMNDPYRYPWGPQNNKAEAFIAAWRHVHRIFREEQATNVLWIWSPHPAYGWFKEYYPGDAYVDWIGAGTLNYGTIAPWSQWWSFDEIFGKHYPALAAFKKPIMLSEFGSLAVGGSRPEWYAAALSEMPKRYPLVRALLFFHFSNDRTTTQQSLDWTIKN
ncbi:MAG TPA: glycosyl hydrolase, partial [Saprospiraceae bacterium]|nr:glycosyl hydrolase [Saprospiraceae bacterium]